MPFTSGLCLQMSYVMCQYQYFVCPIEYSETQSAMTMECEPSRLFRLEEYTLPETMSGLLKLVCIEFTPISVADFLISQ